MLESLRRPPRWAVLLFAVLVIFAAVMPLHPAFAGGGCSTTAPADGPDGGTNKFASPLLGDANTGMTGDFGGVMGTNGFISKLQGYVSTLQGFGNHIFIAMCILEVFIMVTLMVLQGGDAGEMIAGFVKKIVTFGLFYWVLVLHGYQIAMVIISSFASAGNQISQCSGTGYGISGGPSAILAEGVGLATPMLIYSIIFAALPNIFSAFFATIGFTNWQVPLISLQMFGATAVIGAFTFMAGNLLLTTIEAYVVTVVGTIMAPFSPLRYTHALGTQKLLSYAVSVGVKLMMLNLCLGIIQTDLYPEMESQVGIPILGSLTAGFTAIIASMIAMNASTFASGIVTGMASGNFGSTMSAATGAMAGAQSIATGMQKMASSTKDEADSQKAEKKYGESGTSYQDKQNQGGAVRGQGGDTQNTNSSVQTPLSTSHSENTSSQEGRETHTASQQGGARRRESSTTTAETGGTTSNGSGQAPNSSAPGKALGEENQSNSVNKLEQDLKARYGSDKPLSDTEKHDLEAEIKKDKQAIRQEFADGFDSVRDTMMNLAPKNQDQAVGAVNIRSSV